MLKKIIISLLAIYSVTAKSDFIGTKKARAKLFELTDNEVAVFRLTLPEDEFVQLKEEAQGGFGKPPGGFGGNHGNQPPPPPQGGMPEGMGGFNGAPPPGGFPDFGGDFPNFNFTEGGFAPPPGFGDEDSFKTKNATLTVELNNKNKNFKKVTFSLGGSSSRMFGKQGYNFKIRGNDKLYGRTQFRLRPDAREATYLRSKLVCDMHNRLGLPSISANYATLYINGEYMGFYILMDAIKLSWVEFEFGDANSTSLYQCKDMNNNLTVKTSSTGCTNENEEVTDNSEWIELLTRLDAAQSAEDIEDIFDVDQFLTEIAFEYLSGSWDHYLNFGHNFYMYKPKDDKWKFMLYDFDGELGQDVSMGAGGFGFGGNQKKNTSTDYASYSFEDWAKSRHLIDILILNNSTRFDNILRNFVTEVFNPATLFPRIDELKEYIRPYVELDKVPDENGKYPGRLNEGASDYSLAQWDANCEFTTIKTSQGSKAYGLKYWILAKYRYICKAYEMECDEKYLDENYDYTIDKEVEATGDDFSFPGGQGGPPGGFGGFNNQQPNNTTVPLQPTETVVVKPTETVVVEPTETVVVEPTETVVIEPTETVVVEPTETTIPSQPSYMCWVEIIGYPCCSPGNTKVYYKDDNGDWGYDFRNKKWCGITPYEEKADENCWSEEYGYPCCKDCAVYDVDEHGEWGYDFSKKKWCGIQSFCPLIKSE